MGAPSPRVAVALAERSTVTVISSAATITGVTATITPPGNPVRISWAESVNPGLRFTVTESVPDDARAIVNGEPTLTVKGAPPSTPTPAGPPSPMLSVVSPIPKIAWQPPAPPATSAAASARSAQDPPPNDARRMTAVSHGALASVHAGDRRSPPPSPAGSPDDGPDWPGSGPPTSSA